MEDINYYKYQKYNIIVLSDIILNHIRYMKKTIEAKIINIINNFTDMLKNKDTNSIIEISKRFLISQIDVLKVELKSLNEEENIMISILNKRCSNIKKLENNNSFEGLKQFGKYFNKYLISSYLLSKGYFQTLSQLEKDYNFCFMECNIIKEKELLYNFLKNNEINKVLMWIDFYQKKIHDRGLNGDFIVPILTRIYKENLIKISDPSKIDYKSQVEFIRKYFKDYKISHRKEIANLFLDLIQIKDKQQNNDIQNNEKNIENKIIDNKEHLLSSEIKNIIDKEFDRIFLLGNINYFELLISLGLCALNQQCPHKKDISDKKKKLESNDNNIDNKSDNDIIKIETEIKNDSNINPNCPICHLNLLPEIREKFVKFSFNKSYLFCSMSNKLIKSEHIYEYKGKVYSGDSQKFIEEKEKENLKIIYLA